MSSYSMSGIRYRRGVVRTLRIEKQQTNAKAANYRGRPQRIGSMGLENGEKLCVGRGWRGDGNEALGRASYAIAGSYLTVSCTGYTCA